MQPAGDVEQFAMVISWLDEEYRSWYFHTIGLTMSRPRQAKTKSLVAAPSSTAVVPLSAHGLISAPELDKENSNSETLFYKREGERERDRERDRDRQRQTETETDRETERENSNSETLFYKRERERERERERKRERAVSYTHLTLPTNHRV